MWLLRKINISINLIGTFINSSSYFTSTLSCIHSLVLSLIVSYSKNNIIKLEKSFLNRNIKQLQPLFWQYTIYFLLDETFIDFALKFQFVVICGRRMTKKVAENKEKALLETHRRSSIMNAQTNHSMTLLRDADRESGRYRHKLTLTLTWCNRKSNPYKRTNKSRE